MKPKTILISLFVTGAILVVWHLLTPTQPAPTEAISSEEILKEIRTNRKKRVGSLDSATGSFQALLRKAAGRATVAIPQEKTMEEEFLSVETVQTNFLPVTAYWGSLPEDLPDRPVNWNQWQWGESSNEVMIGDRFDVDFDSFVNLESKIQDSGLTRSDLVLLQLAEMDEISPGELLVEHLLAR